MSKEYEIIADFWHCGDICECSYPRVRKLGELINYRYSSAETLAEGPWVSGYEYEETLEQYKWLVEKAKEFNASNLQEIINEYEHFKKIK